MSRAARTVPHRPRHLGERLRFVEAGEDHVDGRCMIVKLSRVEQRCSAKRLTEW